jgi:hypothetical protein
VTPKKVKHRPMTPADVQTRLRAAAKFLDAATLYVKENDGASWQVAGANAVSAGIGRLTRSVGMFSATVLRAITTVMPSTCFHWQRVPIVSPESTLRRFSVTNPTTSTER